MPEEPKLEIVYGLAFLSDHDEVTAVQADKSTGPIPGETPCYIVPAAQHEAWEKALGDAAEALRHGHIGYALNSCDKCRSLLQLKELGFGEKRADLPPGEMLDGPDDFRWAQRVGGD